MNRGNSYYCYLFALIAILKFSTIYSQEQNQGVIQATQISEPIRIDGNLNKPVWREAIPITDFKQREPQEGAEPTEKTKIAVLYDTYNIYFGVWCYDSQPEKITAKDMTRDFNFMSDDDIEIMISPFNDNRNGYFFVTNPNGAMADVWLGGEGMGFNFDWNGVWDVKVTRDDKGWYAEFAIPFSTLKFKKEENQVWSVNFERNIRHKNEQIRWQGWSRKHSLGNIAQGGKLIGLENIKQKERLSITPYITTGVEWIDKKAKGTFKAGGELNYDITPTMKLNFTLNTDFAQVESDRREVNLTRFSIFYPEKRQFFLEGSSYFDMSVSSASLFYSRKIGIEGESVLPIIGGGRLFGKINKTGIGIMTLQTAGEGDIESANSSIIRVKQDLFEESSIGFITTQKFNKDSYSALYGGDFTYSTSKFLGNKNLTTGFSGAISTERRDNKTTYNNKNATYHVFLMYPNDIVSFNMGFNSIQENFNPTLGFIYRSDFKRLYSAFELNPRFRKISHIVRSFSFKLYDAEYYINDKTGATETFVSTFRPFGVNFTSGEAINIHYKYQKDNPTHDFMLLKEVIIPAGIYNDNSFSAEFRTYDGRKLSGSIKYENGSFYTGSRSNISTYINLSLNRHLSLGADWNHNDLIMPQGNFKIDDIGGRINYAFNPRIHTSLFAQWNNDQDDIILNWRINWIPKIGSFFYFVVNQNIDTSEKRLKLTRTTVLAKLVWRFAV